MRRLIAALLWATLGASAAVSAAEPPSALPDLPALVSPATDLSLPGKVIWTDLLTADVDAARQFYVSVFGWEWRLIKPAPGAYGVFYNDGEPVAGVAYRPPLPAGAAPGRWIYGFSVESVEDAGRAIIEAGGRELLPARTHADRGTFAVYAGPEQEPFGILDSQAGDPPDVQARFGDFIWWQLFTHDVPRAIDFYSDVFGYEAFQDPRAPEAFEAFLGRDGYSRAAITLLRPEADAPPLWLGAIRVENMAATLEATVANGGQVLLQPSKELGNEDIAIILDPVGSAIGLLHWDYTKMQGLDDSASEAGQ